VVAVDLGLGFGSDFVALLLVVLLQQSVIVSLFSLEFIQTYDEEYTQFGATPFHQDEMTNP